MSYNREYSTEAPRTHKSAGKDLTPHVHTGVLGCIEMRAQTQANTHTLTQVRVIRSHRVS